LVANKSELGCGPVPELTVSQPCGIATGRFLLAVKRKLIAYTVAEVALLGSSLFPSYLLVGPIRRLIGSVEFANRPGFASRPLAKRGSG
jgi:hypothetical protein